MSSKIRKCAFLILSVAVLAPMSGCTLLDNLKKKTTAANSTSHQCVTTKAMVGINALEVSTSNATVIGGRGGSLNEAFANACLNYLTQGGNDCLGATPDRVVHTIFRSDVPTESALDTEVSDLGTVPVEVKTFTVSGNESVDEYLVSINIPSN